MAMVDQAVEETTFVTPIRNATHSMAELSQRLDSLANRLVGAAPPSPSTASGGGSAGKLSAVPSSVFDQVSDMGKQLNGDIAFAFDCINRIERALP